MLPHRSDTSRGHLHPRRSQPSLSLSLSLAVFPRSSLSSHRPAQLASRGCFSPVRALMPPLSWGRLRAAILCTRVPSVGTVQPTLHQFSTPFSSFLSLPFHPRDVLRRWSWKPMQRPLSTRQISTRSFE